MKQSNMFLTRCLAVLLALALCLGNVSTGLALTVFAADNSEKTSVNAAGSTVQNEQMNTADTDGVATNSITLYNLIAEMYGNSAADAILTSGALAEDVEIAYNLPTADGLELADNILTAKDQDSMFGDYVWEPYTYGPTYDNAGANAFDGNTADWGDQSVFVTYALNLADCAPADMQGYLRGLKTAHEDQLGAMTDLLEWKPDMEQLSRVKLRTFNTVISAYDFTDGDGTDTDAKNLELRAYFQNLIGTLLDECSGETYLTIVDMLNVYKVNGMVYFYQNAEAIAEEVAKLSEALNGLVGDHEKEAALADLMSLFNSEHYIDLIADLGEAMESIGSRLNYDNKEISTESPIALKKFVDAIGAVAAEDIVVEAGELAIVSKPIKTQDDSVVSVVIIIDNNGVKEELALDENFQVGTKVTEELVQTILNKAQETADKIIAETVAKVDVEIKGDVSRFFDVFIDEEALNAQIGEYVNKMTAPKITVAPKQFVINFMDKARTAAEPKFITVLDRTIELPPYSDDMQLRYEYFIDGLQVGLDGYHTFSIDEMDTLFVEQEYVMERNVIDYRAEMINKLIAGLNKKLGEGAAVLDENGNTVTVTLPGARSMTDLALGISETNIGYIGLNGEKLLYEEVIEDDQYQRLSIQTLINALLADPAFSQQTIIDLAENNGGVLLTTNAQLGLDSGRIVVEDLELVIKMNSVPEKLNTLSKVLSALENNFTFNSSTIVDTNGAEHAALAFNLTAPEKIYEAYLAVLLASWEVNYSNINDINNEIAIDFFYDYVDAIMGSENISLNTFENTLDLMIAAANKLPKIDILDKDVLDVIRLYNHADKLPHGTKLPDVNVNNIDANELAKGFELLKKLYNNCNYYAMGDAAGQMVATTSDAGILEIMDLLGIDLDVTFYSLIAELQPGAESAFWATANLTNTSKDFEALVIDLDAGVAGTKDIYHAYKDGELKEEAVELVKGHGLANAIDFTTNLSKRASELTGQAVIVLMGDTTGDLVVNEATILDLNGHTINGNVVANGHLLIVDSTVSNNQAGGVNGDVSGYVMIISGNYTDDVTAYLKDGYAQENGMVHNELYRVVKNGNNVTYVLNSDVMHEKAVAGLLPNMGVVAAELAIDLAMNQFPLTYLAANGEEILHLNLEDIVGALVAVVNSEMLYEGASEILDTVKAIDVREHAKKLADELLDFVDIAKSISVDDFLHESPEAVIESIQIMHNAADIAKELAAELKEWAVAAKDVKNSVSLRDFAKRFALAADANEIKALIKALGSELKDFADIVRGLNIPTNYDEMTVAGRKVVDLINGSGIFGLCIEIGSELKDFEPYAKAVAGAAIQNKDKIDAATEAVINVLKDNDVINFQAIAGLAKEIALDLYDFGAMADAIDNDRQIGAYAVSIAPWDLTVDHIYGNGDDYLTVGFEANMEELKTINVGLQFEGENVKQFVALLREMKDILDPVRSYLNIDIFKPTAENKVLGFGGTIEGRLSVDLTVDHNADGEQNCYPLIIGVALAYANADNREELVKALNMDSPYNFNLALKDAIDNCTVEDVITALKAMDRFTSFYEMADAIGVKVSAEDAELEAIWHFVTVAFGKLLELGDEIGRESKLGALDPDGDGVYVLESTHDAYADVYAKGYGLYINAEKLYECFELKVFDIDCLWGDVNHDGYVNAKDASLILQKTVGNLEEGTFFCYLKSDVSADGKTNAKDASLVLQYTVDNIDKFPAED